MFKIGVCDLCGTENRLFKTQIEGTVLNVCHHCAKYGKVLANVHDKKFIQKMQEKRQFAPKPAEKELLETIIENYAEVIKKKRESLNLTQEDFAKKLNEKESLIHKIETGTFEPNIALARKIERFLHVKLVEQLEDDKSKPAGSKSESFTLGDFIKVK